jgi:hypothetical protein
LRGGEADETQQIYIAEFTNESGKDTGTSGTGEGRGTEVRRAKTTRIPSSCPATRHASLRLLNRRTRFIPFSERKT